MNSVLRAIRRHPLLTAAAVPAGVLALFWGYGSGRPVSAAEKHAPLPGDELLPAEDRVRRMQTAITIDAPPERVWPYLAQLGLRKAGFYSFDWLERLATFHIYNTYDVVDEWQDMKPGDWLSYHQAGVGTQIREVEPDRHFTSVSDTRTPPAMHGAFALKPPFGLDHFAWTWNFVLIPTDDGRTRFISRCDSSWSPQSWWRTAGLTLALGSPSVFMSRRMMDVIKACAEDRVPLPPVVRVLNKVGVFAPGYEHTRLRHG